MTSTVEAITSLASNHQINDKESKEKLFKIHLHVSDGTLVSLSRCCVFLWVDCYAVAPILRDLIAVNCCSYYGVDTYCGYMLVVDSEYVYEMIVIFSIRYIYIYLCYCYC